MKASVEQLPIKSVTRPTRLLLHLLVWALGVGLGGANAQPQAPRRESGQAQSGKPVKAPTPLPGREPGTKPSQAKLSNEEVAEARKLLDALGYWVDLEATAADTSLRHALIAFQKIEGRPHTVLLTQPELQALRQATSPAPLETSYDHIEVDLQRQVLFMVDSCNASVHILPISSGSGEWFTEGDVTRRAVTPTGRFKVQRKIAGWHKSPLGLLYYPNYFYAGYAIHGNPLVPSRPASHGCVRIPMFAARALFEFANIGLPVIVHDVVPEATTSSALVSTRAPKTNK